jgi:DNA-binding GntR family transcriptional regulator
MVRKSQNKLVYEALRQRILIYELMPDERLPEEFWAAKLNVSRPAVREALTRLLGEGLVRAGNRGGYFVRMFGDEDTRQLRELREIYETSAFVLACNRHCEEHLTRLDEVCADFDNLIKKGYHNNAWECDLRFHQILLEASGNKHLLQAYERSNIPLFQLKINRELRFESCHETTSRQHRMIALALRERDKEKGLEILRIHIRTGASLTPHGQSLILEHSPDPQLAST